MHDDYLVQQLREAIEKASKRTPEEWFAAMIKRGVIDEKGRVLRRMPTAPPWELDKLYAEDDAAANPPPADTNGTAATDDKQP
jgi:hypothetical protein